MHCRQEVVFLVVQHVIPHRHTWCHQLGNTTLHHLVSGRKSLLTFQFFSLFLRVFQLVANSHALASPNQFRQICIKSVVRKTSHSRFTTIASIVSFRERDAQDARTLNGIIAIRLIKVATPKEQQRIGMLPLHAEKLFHHWCKTFIFLCHRGIFLLNLQSYQKTIGRQNN